MTRRVHRRLPPLSLLREHLVVDPASPSGLSWKSHAPGRRHDLRAGSLHASGCWEVTFGRTLKVSVSRIVWALTRGEDPVGFEIDPIDGDRRNNAPENLRRTVRGGRLRSEVSQ